MSTSVTWVALFVLVGFFFLGFGAALTVLGLRGRVVDDHPLCRKCGFDLTGRPTGSERCSECGADLALPNAIRVGHRARRGRAVAGGVLLSLLGLLLLVPLLLAAISGVNWQAVKPVWWLESEARAGDTSALQELNRRMTAGELSETQTVEIVGVALDLQADASKKWDARWGELVESRRASGKLSDEQWSRYAKQGVGLALEARPRVRRGDPLPVWFVEGPNRYSDSSRFSIHYDSRDRRIFVNGIEIVRDPNNGSSSGGSSLSNGSGGKSGATVELKTIIGQLKDGKNTLKIKTSWKIREDFREDVPPIAVIQTENSADFNLEPSDRPTVTVRADPTLRGGVERAITIETVDVSSYDRSYVHVEVKIGATPVPIGVGYAIIGRAKGKEWKLGTFACPAGATNHSWGTGGEAEDLPKDLTSLDIILRPDVQVAASTTDTFEIWDGEVVFHDVKLIRRKTRNSNW